MGLWVDSTWVAIFHGLYQIDCFGSNGPTPSTRPDAPGFSDEGTDELHIISLEMLIPSSGEGHVTKIGHQDLPSGSQGASNGQGTGGGSDPHDVV